MWRTEEAMRKKNEKIEKLTAQTERLEAERNMLKQTERELEEKVSHIVAMFCLKISPRGAILRYVGVRGAG